MTQYAVFTLRIVLMGHNDPNGKHFWKICQKYIGTKKNNAEIN